MFKKLSKKYWIVIVVSLVVLIGALGSFGYYRSDKATMDRFVQAIQDKNIKEIQTYCDRYQNGQKISKEQIEWFVDGFGKNPSEATVRKVVEDEKLFKMRNKGKLFAVKTFEPKMCQIDVSTTGLAQESFKLSAKVNQDKSVINAKDGEFKAFLPNKYKMTFIFSNDAFSDVKVKREINFKDECNVDINVDIKSLLIKDEALQKKLAQNAMAMMVSWADAINHNFDFSKLQCSTQEFAQTLLDTYKLVPEVFSDYEMSFDTLVINADSMSMSSVGSDEIPEIKMYGSVNRNLKLTVKPNEDLEIEEATPLETTNDGDFEITFVYDKEQQMWKVQAMAFDVYKQHVDSWKNKQTVKLKEPCIGRWSEDQQNRNESI